MSPAQAGVADGLLVNIPVLGNNHLTWGRTVMDSQSADVKLASKRQSSLDRQIRSGVYLRRDWAVKPFGGRLF